MDLTYAQDLVFTLLTDVNETWSSKVKYAYHLTSAHYI
jgi:hypothetical protein